MAASSDGPARTPPQQPMPASIRWSVTLVWAVVVVSVVNVVLTYVLMDDLVASAMQTGAEGLTEETARQSIVFGGVLGLLFAVLWVLLGVLLRRGVSWARMVLTVLAGIGVLFGSFGLSVGGRPGAFLLLGVVTLVLQVALLFFLWRRDSSRFLKAGARPAS